MLLARCQETHGSVMTVAMIPGGNPRPTVCARTPRARLGLGREAMQSTWRAVAFELSSSEKLHEAWVRPHAEGRLLHGSHEAGVGAMQADQPQAAPWAGAVFRLL